MTIERDQGNGLTPVLSVRDLRTEFAAQGGTVRAVDGVSFDIMKGERVAIVGESGSGKSAMAMSLVRLLAYPGRVTGGQIFISGRDILSLSERQMNGIRGRNIATVFQDPMSSLDPVMRIEQQMVPPLMRQLSLTRSAAHDIALTWLEKVGLPDAKNRIHAYPFEMSGGMRQRVMIAMALSFQPQLIIADEPTTALDVTIQAQIVELLKQLTGETGTSMLFITHDLGLVARFAHKVGVMYAGRLVEFGPADRVFKQPRHPYTRSLLGTIPKLNARHGERLVQIPGTPPDMRHQISGCAFRPRCSISQDICAQSVPMLDFQQNTHIAACWVAPNDSLVEPALAIPIVDRSQNSATNNNPDIVELNDIYKTFVPNRAMPWSSRSEIHALRGISLRLKSGETLGIVGESGCGKSTLARLLLGLDLPSKGQIFTAGRIQMVFQDPYSSFNPKMSIRQIIDEPMVVAKAGSAAERAKRVGELVEQVGLDASYLARHPHELSGGQRQRIAIARALALKPAILVADEPTSALDVSIRAQIINLLSDLKVKLGLSLIFISHDLLTVQYISDRIAVMYFGEIVEYGPAADVFGTPAHPYTRGLLEAIPTPDPALEATRTTRLLSGEMPNPSLSLSGCAFVTRCPIAGSRCQIEKPQLTMHSRKHETACHYPLTSFVKDNGNAVMAD